MGSGQLLELLWVPEGVAGCLLPLLQLCHEARLDLAVFWVPGEVEQLVGISEEVVQLQLRRMGVPVHYAVSDSVFEFWLIGVGEAPQDRGVPSLVQQIHDELIPGVANGSTRIEVGAAVAGVFGTQCLTPSCVLSRDERHK